MQILQRADRAYRIARVIYRRRIKRPWLRVYRPCKRLYLRIHAWVNRPPTPEETAKAQAQLRLVLKHINDAVNEKRYDPEQHLTDAAKALNRSRWLDPGAQIKVPEKDYVHTYDHDKLAGWVLYLQSIGLARAVNNMLYEFEPGETDPNELKAATPLREKAYKAAAKACKYDPENIDYQIQLARTAPKRESRRIVREILKKDPHNLEALELVGR
jgi:hypothetical protein